MAKMGQQGKIVHFKPVTILWNKKNQKSNNDIVFQDQQHILVWSVGMKTRSNKQTDSTGLFTTELRHKD